MKSSKKGTKICRICNLGIDTSKEYATFIHWKKEGKVFTSSDYHVSCFREKMLGKTSLDKMQKQASDLLNFVRNQLGVEEVVDLDVSN